MQSSHHDRAARTIEETRRAIAAALQRLLSGKPTHPKHVGRDVRITVASVCREARLSRQPLYQNHRDLLETIRQHTAVVRPNNTTAEQKRANHRLRIAELERQVQKALSENLTLVVRLNELSTGKISNMLPVARRGAGAGSRKT